jgi:hypothetical protein
LSTRETVIIETPAICATSSIRLPVEALRRFLGGESGIVARVDLESLVDMARDSIVEFMLALTYSSHFEE